MKFEVTKKVLLPLLTRSLSIVEKKNSMDVLLNVLFQVKGSTLKLFATDLEISLIDEVSVITQEPGRIAVNPKHLFEIIKELEDDSLTIQKKENNWLEIKQYKSDFHLVSLNPDEYPGFSENVNVEFSQFEAKTIKEMIEKTIYSVSNDETRYHLNGVFLERQNFQDKKKYRMVATDGYRLSLIDRSLKKSIAEDGPFQNGIIIPRKGLFEIKKILELKKTDLNEDSTIEIAVDQNQLIVKSGKTILLISLIEGKYPNYLQFIPETLEKKAKVPRENLLSALKRVSVLSNHKARGVTLSFTEGKLEISSSNLDLGDAREEIDIEYLGEDTRIGFNAKYMLDVLGSFENPEVEFRFQDEMSPGIMRPFEDPSYTCVIMPMRI